MWNGDKNKDLTLEECSDKIKLSFRDIIIDLQNSDTWIIQSTITSSFISSKDIDEDRIMHAKGVEFMSNDNVNDIVDKLWVT